MGKKQLGIRSSKTKTTKSKEALVYARPAWVKSGEEELCPDCFKVVGDKSRYNLVCLLGKAKEGMTVGQLTDQMQLRQPTISHHLNILRSVDAVEREVRGRESVYTLNRSAPCFEDCQVLFT